MEDAINVILCIAARVVLPLKHTCFPGLLELSPWIRSEATNKKNCRPDRKISLRAFNSMLADSCSFGSLMILPHCPPIALIPFLLPSPFVPNRTTEHVPGSGRCLRPAARNKHQSIRAVDLFLFFFVYFFLTVPILENEVMSPSVSCKPRGLTIRCWLQVDGKDPRMR